MTTTPFNKITESLKVEHPKPIYRLADEESSVLNIVNMVNDCLLANNQADAASKFTAKAVSCSDYEEILILVMHYVIVKRICPRGFCGKELGGTLEYIGRSKRGWIYICNKCRTQFLRDIGTGNMHFRYSQ